MIKTADRNAQLKECLRKDPRNPIVRKVGAMFLTEEARRMWEMYKMRFQYGATYEDIAEKYSITRQRAKQLVKVAESSIERILA